MTEISECVRHSDDMIECCICSEWLPGAAEAGEFTGSYNGHAYCGDHFPFVTSGNCCDPTNGGDCHECGHVFDGPCCCINQEIDVNNCEPNPSFDMLDMVALDAADAYADALGIMDDFLAQPDTAVTECGTLYCTECGIVLMPNDLSWNDTQHMRAPRCPNYLLRGGKPVSPWMARAIDGTLPTFSTHSGAFAYAAHA